MAWSLPKAPSGIPKVKEAWKGALPKAPIEKVPKASFPSAAKLDLRKASGIKNPLAAKNEQAAVTSPRGLRYGGLLSR